MKRGFRIITFLSQSNKIFDMFWGIFREKPQGDIPKLCMDDCICLSQWVALLSSFGTISIGFEKNSQDTEQYDQYKKTETKFFFQPVPLL